MCQALKSGGVFLIFGDILFKPFVGLFDIDNLSILLGIVISVTSFAIIMGLISSKKRKKKENT